MSGFRLASRSRREQLSLYSLVNQSNIKQLSRIALNCNNYKRNVLECIFQINQNNPCNSNNVTYYSPNRVFILDPSGVSTWQGICSYNNQVILCGTTMPSATAGAGVIYIGNIQCTDPSGQYIKFYVPGSKYTSCYGPRYDSDTELLSFVGSYNNPGDNYTYGFLFVGSLNELTDSTKYIYKMQPNNDEYPITFVHSTYGNFAVGASGNLPPKNLQDKAWIYDITQQIYTDFKFNNATYNTIYGIVQNSEYNYTIVGGFSDLSQNITTGFICDFDYDPQTYNLTYSNQTSIQITSITHFEGISKTRDSNVYTLAADLETGGAGIIVGRNFISSKFDVISIQRIDYSCSIGSEGFTTSNSVLGNNFIGYFISSNNNSSAWQCSVNF